MAADFKIFLHLLHHGRHHLSQRSAQEHLRLANNVLWDIRSKKEVCAFVCEMVAVMLEHIIVLLCKPRRNFLQELHEQLQRDLSLPQCNGLGRISEWGAAWRVAADSAAEVELFVVDNNAGVPNSFNEATDEGLRKLSSHPV